MKRNKLDTFKNGIVVRMHNRKMTALKDEDGKVTIEFLNATEKPEEVSCSHRVVRGVRVTNIALSDEAMDALCSSWIRYKHLLS